MNEKEKQPPGL